MVARSGFRPGWFFGEEGGSKIKINYFLVLNNFKIIGGMGREELEFLQKSIFRLNRF